MKWGDFLRLMQREFFVYAIPSTSKPGVRLVESPFKLKDGKSIYVVPDDRADIISPKNINAVLERFELREKFSEAYNRFFKLTPPGELPFPER